MNKKYKALALSSMISLVSAINVKAGVTPQEAQLLKTTLTPMGAEKSGNSAGTIPAWTGGDTTVPPGYVSGHARPDPFANERPLFAITAANHQQYAAKLPAGAVELLTRFPGFQIDIYPTHRTAAAPQFVYDYTFRNATSGALIDNGNGVSGVFGGVPFPIPKSGSEVLWNSLLRWQGIAEETVDAVYTVASNSAPVLVNSSRGFDWVPYYDANFDPATTGSPLSDNAFEKIYITTLAPAFAYGQGNVFFKTLDPGRDGTPAWEYLVGQRRVRKAPNLQYDTPNAVVSGVSNFDEFNGFYGSPDHYDWKLVGKKEMFVPYNENRLTNLTADQTLGPNTYKPGTVRWELHRVWMVEANLAAGARHTVPKRVLYMDEDTWQILVEDEYDGSGKYFKFLMNTCFDMPEFPATAPNGAGLIWDFHTGNYAVTIYPSPDSVVLAKVKAPPASFFTPANLTSSGTW